jgi:hypothetical protein
VSGKKVSGQVVKLVSLKLSIEDRRWGQLLFLGKPLGENLHQATQLGEISKGWTTLGKLQFPIIFT